MNDLDDKLEKQTLISRIDINKKISSKTLFYMCIFIFSSILLVIEFNIIVKERNVKIEESRYVPIQHEVVDDYTLMDLNEEFVVNLPEKYQYNKIDEEKLLSFLNSRNSLLAEEPYFSAIIDTSKEFNLNPLVLFAITGQEQGFVTRDNEFADEIINNPFNVYHSWEEYNTNIFDSCRIAAKTIINLSEDRPEEVEVFQWINKRYAEDQNWYKGVNMIYDELVQATQ